MKPAPRRGMSDRPLLEVEDLSKHFDGGSGMFGGGSKVRAVDGVSFTVMRGETLGLVGESGSGKSTTARLVLRLLDPTGGRVRFDGTDITQASAATMRPLRRRMQMVFQDPYASLDPRMTVRQTLEEPLTVHGSGNAAARRARVDALLSLVNLSGHHAGRYAHEFSGGQRQRVGIARALALEPDLVVCDEPVSALDVSIQAQVINLLKDLQARLGLSYLFIAHDLAVVKHMADRIAVMYLGRLVEIAGKEQLFSNPRHPYSRMLLAAIPGTHPESQPEPQHELQADRALAGHDLPRPGDPPGGCPFHPRCAFAIGKCREEVPPLIANEAGHLAACHRQDELPPWQPAAAMAPSATASRRLAIYALRRAAMAGTG